MKTCKKCGERYPLGNFYKNRRYKDGLFSECKACYKEKAVKPSKEARGRATKKFREKWPDKVQANTAAKSRFKLLGHEAHHWSYNAEHFLDIIPIEKAEHYIIHRALEYDAETKMYRRKDNGSLLSNKESHKQFIYETLLNQTSSNL